MYSVILVYVMSISNHNKNISDVVVQVPKGKELKKVCNDMKNNHNEVYKMYKNNDIVFVNQGNNEILDNCIKGEKNEKVK